MGPTMIHHQAEVNARIRAITQLIIALERSITAALQSIEYLAAERRELGENLIDDSNLVTTLVDMPVLHGGNRLTVKDAQRIVGRLRYHIEHHGDGHTADTDTTDAGGER